MNMNGYFISWKEFAILNIDRHIIKANVCKQMCVKAEANLENVPVLTAFFQIPFAYRCMYILPKWWTIIASGKVKC
jgi:hypothetical protein